VKPLCHKCLWFGKVAVYTQGHGRCPHADKTLPERVDPKQYMRLHNITPPK
jgi:hypothetical protein